MPTNETPQVSENNNIIQDISDDNLFVRLWKQGKEILTPLSNLFKSVTDVIPESASEENKLVTEADLKDVTDLIPEGTTEENPLVNVAILKILEEELLSINPPAANTLRFEFSKMDYDPTVAGVGSSGTWKKVSAKFHNVWDWTGSGTSFANTFVFAFRDIDNLVSVIAVGDTSSVTDMGSMFEDCTSLTSVPLFDTSSVTDMSSTFNGCTKVEGGALALYQRVSTQATPPYHTNTFKNCGKDTVTGAAELAQIPASWGGTASA